ncbi:hypothetical protein [Microbulbifer discodermiae]|uniref:hypothetical protein n=1 Tax=Microbulbifer sp. 2201CG32-9 TaxID=3232309 RepID=UPI00345B7B95
MSETFHLRNKKMVYEIEERTLRAMVSANTELKFALREFKPRQYHLLVNELLGNEIARTYYLSKTQRPGLRVFRSLDRATEFIRKVKPDCSGIRVIKLKTPSGEGDKTIGF